MRSSRPPVEALRRWLGVLALVLAFATALPLATASAATVQQIVQLRSSDGRAVPALVTYPEGGPDTDAPVAIIHHGGPGGEPLRALGAPRWAAAYFAERGYITISLLSRISRDVIDQPFGAGVADIKGAVDWASQMSAGPIVLVGHSAGSVSNTLYMAQTHDPRVKAIVHFAPTFPGSRWMPVSMGADRYAQVVARLRKMVAEGRGDEPIYEDHHLAPPAPQTVTYGYLMSASTWLSWWGPDTRQDNLALFPQIHVPMLMISGDADIFVSRAYQEALRKAAVNSPRVDSIILDGGVPHEFTGSEQKAAGLAYDWLASLGIRPLPRITTRVVDLKAGGDVRPGLLFEPTDPALRKPMAVMMEPDFADDILLSPLEKLGPRLARAGYTVLIPQDRGGGWAFYRAVAADMSDDQRAWLTYLGTQGHAKVAVIAQGWAGTLVPALLSTTPPPSLGGVALIEPPDAPAAYASRVLGPEDYVKAVDQAQDAVKDGKGGTTMIIAPYEHPAQRKWLMHMAKGFLSFWGPAAPPAPVPALHAAGVPVLLVGAGQGQLVGHAAQSAMARDGGATSLWYDGVATPFDAPDRLTADLTAWLDAHDGAPGAAH